jgi:hypothetical protein
MGGERGLVVCRGAAPSEIRSYNTIGPGTTREEFVRLLVTSDDGARNAKIPIDDTTRPRSTSWKDARSLPTDDHSPGREAGRRAHHRDGGAIP